MRSYDDIFRALRYGTEAKVDTVLEEIADRILSAIELYLVDVIARGKYKTDLQVNLTQLLPGIDMEEILPYQNLIKQLVLRDIEAAGYKVTYFEFIGNTIEMCIYIKNFTAKDLRLLSNVYLKIGIVFATVGVIQLGLAVLWSLANMVSFDNWRLITALLFTLAGLTLALVNLKGKEEVLEKLNIRSIE